MEIGDRVIKGVRPNKRYQKYFDRANKLYFGGGLPATKVYTAPLLKITHLSQTEAQDEGNWLDAGEYGLLGWNESEGQCMILDRGTSVFHPLLAYQTVLHEAIHMSVNPYGGHGKIFKTEIRRIAALGALDNLI